jgi:ABC-type nitrate/sulfonate/bicarbonate transport system substrate-binding protein
MQNWKMFTRYALFHSRADRPYVNSKEEAEDWYKENSQPKAEIINRATYRYSKKVPAEESLMRTTQDRDTSEPRTKTLIKIQEEFKKTWACTKKLKKLRLWRGNKALGQ